MKTAQYCIYVIKSFFLSLLIKQVSYVSCSSTFTTHPLPMDQSMLKNSDALIMTGITEAPTANPDAMLGEFCTHLGKDNPGHWS